jgi:hypothetical protein
MKLISNVNILSVMFLWSFIGCGVSELDESSKSNSGTTISGTTETAVGGVSVQIMDASLDNYKVLKLNGDKNLQLKLGNDAKDVYVLFSNPTNSTKSARVNHNQKISKNLNVINKESRTDNLNYSHAKKDIQNFNNRVLDLKSVSSSSKKVEKVYRKTTDKVNDSEIFYMKSTSTDVKIKATAKKVITNVETSFGKKSLTIWVEDNAYVDECKKPKCIDSRMVNTLADKFLQEGKDNDIYDWVTNVFGEEWGSSKSSELISEPNHIDILLTDISDDNKTNGGVIGYFYSKDNFKASKYKGSNERIMFYIDSVMYANGTNGWDENDFWPQQVFSTLAHEFQHMIYFYQKNVKQNLQGSEPWINEMLSESTEDLVAVKMNVDGPRNVAASRGDAGSKNNYNGRYPHFNKNNTISLKSWDNTLANYSTVSSFGAYLLRNYGGAELLHTIVNNELINEEALMYAVHQHVNGKSKTFDDLIHEWGIAVLLSKRDDISIDSGVLYNAGDFISSDFNKIHYDLGSINFFNYNTQPSLATRMGKISPHANYYYKVGENLRGDVDVDISGTAGLNVSVVVVK